MNSQFIKAHPTTSAALSSLLMMMLMSAMYLAFEPVVVSGQDATSDSFTITQTIDDAIAFTAQPQPVSMSDSLSGLTGGAAIGSTTFSIATNNPDGYTVRIQFADEGTGTSSGDAMINTENSDVSIPNGPSTVSYDLDIPAINQPAAFAYTASGDFTEQTFRSSGSDCDQSAGTATGENCWLMQGTITSPEPIMTRTESTSGSGDEGVVHFRVVVGPDPDPGLPAGTYTATATLTAIQL